MKRNVNKRKQTVKVKTKKFEWQQNCLLYIIIIIVVVITIIIIIKFATGYNDVVKLIRTDTFRPCVSYTLVSATT